MNMLLTLKRADQETLAAVAEEMRLRGTTELFLLFAMGSQFDHHIKLMLERFGVYCIVADPRSFSATDVKALAPIGIVVSGGPASVHAEPPPFDEAIFDLGIPTLGICLGLQMWARHLGARVVASDKREFGPHTVEAAAYESELFEGCGDVQQVLMSHGDSVEHCDAFRITLASDQFLVAAAEQGHLYGVQFHPEVTHTLCGQKIFENFVFGICKAVDRFPAEDIAQRKINELRSRIGNSRVLLALSGGSDSSTVAYLLKKALADRQNQIHAVYIKGIDRPDDERHVRGYFSDQGWLELSIVDATEQFLAAVAGIRTMKEKRLAMRGVYKAILEEEARQIGAAFIAQGTLYTDISESGGGYDSQARKAVIKIHHNTNLGFSLPELMPLADLFKDGARNVGRAVGVPEALLTRHPFPGPGLLVRIEGEVTAERLHIARQCDGIYIEELRKHKLYDTAWQAGAVVTRSETTYTKGDDAGNGCVVALWAVWSVDGFTATAADLPMDFLRDVSRRITNEIREVGSVVYRISDKPPATIEWG